MSAYVSMVMGTPCSWWGTAMRRPVLKAGINPKIVSHRCSSRLDGVHLSVHAHTFQASTGEAADEIAALVLGTAEGSV